MYGMRQANAACLFAMWILLFLSLEGGAITSAAALGSSIAGGNVGRTVPSFRIALAEEESEWKEYRKHLDVGERQDFDDMFAIPRLYLSACSAATKLVRVYPVFMSIALHHYMELKSIAEEIGVTELITCH